MQIFPFFQKLAILVFSVVRFCYHSYDYRPNYTPLSLITITYEDVCPPTKVKSVSNEAMGLVSILLRYRNIVLTLKFS